jgi:hypothetical protein
MAHKSWKASIRGAVATVILFPVACFYGAIFVAGLICLKVLHPEDCP